MYRKKTGWSYYVPANGEDASDATPISIYVWQTIYDAEHAAELAAEDEWDNHDGWEAGVGEGPEIVVIDPDGKERRFSTEREAEINHMVDEIK